jgi:hypothetical protein
VYATAGDAWVGSTSDAWLTLRIGNTTAARNISSSGQQTVTVVVAANVSVGGGAVSRRSGTVTLAGFTFTVTQAYR